MKSGNDVRRSGIDVSRSGMVGRRSRIDVSRTGIDVDRTWKVGNNRLYGRFQGGSRSSESRGKSLEGR